MSSRSSVGAARAVALLALVAVAALVVAPRAGAQSQLFWENWSGAPDSISYANLDGGGGGPVNLAGATLNNPEGLAYDTVTNRLFVANTLGGPGEAGEIVYVNLDGGGAGTFSAPGAPVANPEGIAVDPVTRTVYWVNSKFGEESIAWAALDGGQGGTVSTAGASFEFPYKVALDTAGGRIFWANRLAGADVISYARLDNSGGGDLSLAGASPPGGVSGLAIDPLGNRIYWSDAELAGRFSYASLAGGGGGDLPTPGAFSAEPYGLAVDPDLGVLYWGNYGVLLSSANAFGYAAVNGGGGGNISPSVAPVAGPQDPVIVKDPASTAPPAVSRSSSARQWLSCTQGEWGADYPGAFVYRAPRSYAYSWLRNGQPVAGASSNLFQATRPGSYACLVTAANQVGQTAAGSGSIKVNRAKLKTLVKTKLRKTKRGKKAVFRVQYYNQGDLKSSRPRVCAIVPKKLRKLLKAPKCRKLGGVRGKGRKGTTLPVYVKPKAKNKSYKLKFVVKGVPSKPGFGRVKVTGKR